MRYIDLKMAIMCLALDRLAWVKIAGLCFKETWPKINCVFELLPKNQLFE